MAAVQRASAVATAAFGLTLVAGLAAAASTAPDVHFGPPVAEGGFGEDVTFSTTFDSDVPPERVELLTRIADQESDRVAVASVEPDGTGWRATVTQTGHVVPNTTWEYRFRVVTDEGDVIGPSGTHRLLDTRFEWDVLEGDTVDVWTYDGDDGFAARALEVAEDALDAAAEVMGVEVAEPVDFIIYSNPRAFRQAMGPATRENIEGQAHLGIRTLFALVESGRTSSDRVAEVITHELAHLVFHDAVVNPFQYPPRWLNEGVAVYLSEGYPDSYRGQVQGAAGGGTIIPLEALGGQFPTRANRQSLAYAESIDAVDHLVATYGEPALVELIHAFGDGLGLDGSFVAATGDDFAAFESAWLDSLGAEPPEPYGPRPVEPGPVPDVWATEG